MIQSIRYDSDRRPVPFLSDHFSIVKRFRFILENRLRSDVWSRQVLANKVDIAPSAGLFSGW